MASTAPFSQFTLIPADPSTKAMLRRSVLMNKVSELKASKEDSVEVVQLAETAFDNLKVHSYIITHVNL